MVCEDNQKYLARLPEYSQEGNPEKHDYTNANQGWKLHLNVSPENVVAVSAYLKSTGFSHKFISGANIDRGKIFTVYIGSKSLTEKFIKEIQDEAGHLLEDPKALGDILVSPKIAARFGLYHHQKFINQGYFNGIPLMKYYDEDDVVGSLENSKKTLLSEFGDYFGTEIEYYDPHLSSQ
jgi:hypothetical protein